MWSSTRMARADGVQERLHFLRQQANREGSEPCRSLADFIAPRGTGLEDTIGAFAVTSGIGLKELCDGFKAEHDDYNAIMAEAMADRLAEAFAECLHKRVREEWGYGCEEKLSTGRSDRGEISRDSAGAGLSGVSRPHGEGHDLAPARRGGEYRNAAHGVVCDVAGVERERALFRASGVPVFQCRERSIATRWRITRAQGDERGRSGALAGTESELRTCGSRERSCGQLDSGQLKSGLRVGQQVQEPQSRSINRLSSVRLDALLFSMRAGWRILPQLRAWVFRGEEARPSAFAHCHRTSAASRCPEAD